MPHPARQASAAARAVWSGLDAAANPIATLAMLAGLVRALTPASYGILVLALAASGLSLAINPAIAATTTRFVSQAAGAVKSSRESVAGVVTAALLAVTVIDLLLLLATALLRAPLARWIFGGATAGAGTDAGDVLWFALLAVAIQQLDAVLAAAIRGLERFARQALIETLARAALAAAVVWAAWHTRSVAAVLIAQCIVCALSVLVRAVALRQLLPDRRLFRRSGRAQISALFSYGGWMWLTALASVVYTSADRIIVGRWLGPAVAGQFSIYIQLTQLIHFVPSSLFAFVLPAFSRLTAQGGDGARQIAPAYRTYLGTISCTALVLALGLLVCWPLLLRAFAGGMLRDPQWHVTLLLTLNFLVLACNVAPYYLLLALGHSRAVSVISSGAMAVALLLMMVLIPRYGMAGAALARLAYGVATLVFLAQAHRVLKLQRAAGP
ncbi:MAG TPA: oligosaccharide flippase family protein [Steroidobacteraceae bacterium]|jgi:O-antigen/teichoic acid export membrane protein|nr:oligosaccharide flippase family protein [Steroidobacteraceae bacterium]